MIYTFTILSAILSSVCNAQTSLSRSSSFWAEDYPSYGLMANSRFVFTKAPEGYSVYNAKTGYKFRDPVIFLPTDNLLLSEDHIFRLRGGNIVVYEFTDTTTLNYKKTFDHKNAMRIMTVSPNGKYLYSSSGNGVYIWNVELGTYIGSMFGSDDAFTISNMVVSQDGLRLYASLNSNSGSFLIHEFEIATKRLLKTYRGNGIIDESFIRTDSHLAITDNFLYMLITDGGSRRLERLDLNNFRRTELKASEWILSIDANDDGLFVTTSPNQMTKIYNVQDGSTRFNLVLQTPFNEGHAIFSANRKELWTYYYYSKRMIKYSISN